MKKPLYNLVRKSYNNENDVREEFITPLLKMLGYRPEEIERGKYLETPYYSGTKKKEIIIPDYIVKVNDKNAFVIDAKSPKESIEDKKYISQAYSYAVHRNIQAYYFVLSNAYCTNIYDTKTEEFNPIISVSIEKLENQWGQIIRLISKNVIKKLVEFENLKLTSSNKTGIIYWTNGIPFTDNEKLKEMTHDVFVHLAKEQHLKAVKKIKDALLLTIAPTERMALLLTLGNSYYILGKSDDALNEYMNVLKISTRLLKKMQ